MNLQDKDNFYAESNNSDDFIDFDDDFDEDEFEEFDDYEDFEDDFEDEFEEDFDDFDDFDNLDSKSKEDIDIFDEKPLETDPEYDRTAVEVHISSQLSSQKIVELLDTYPALKRITCPKSIYDRIPKRYIDALEEENVFIEIKYNWGKKKYGKEEIDSVIDLFNEGMLCEEIAEELDMSLNEVSYIKSKYSKRIAVKHYKRKYSDQQKENIVSMRENGLKPREIAEKENIPIRTVYYILNKK